MKKKLLLLIIPLYILFTADQVYSKINHNIYLPSVEDSLKLDPHSDLIIKPYFKLKTKLYFLPPKNSEKKDTLTNLVPITHHYSQSGSDLDCKLFILYHTFLFYT